ncbi:hypothetical protein R1flu_020662 [Riccia fluitans]|uniref:Uncharacterized protein n=1 Tax=Riccia fluitans TaxID=41844 RepID=A0ABD1ZQV6_9MARC
MKLFIEVEISPDEIPLANELFRTLRTLTDHVRTRDLPKLFRTIISRLEDGNHLEQVAAEISTLLTESVRSETVYDDLFGAFTSVVFNQELVLRQQSVVPFMLLLPRLPEPAQTKLRDALIPKVLKHLTVKRPVDASRMDFFAHAEAFASLVTLEFVSISGAITTIIALLRKPENRSAAVTMLGKTVELCLQQLTDKCDPSALADLNAALQNVTEDVFQYDINYIEDSMGWSRQPAVSLDSTRVSPVQPPGDLKKGLADGSGGLHAVESFLGHRQTVFAMAYDEKRNQLISGGKDGTLIAWTTDGQISETVEMARHYACSMDVHPSLQTLLVCGVAKEEAPGPAGTRILPPPCIVSYGPNGRGWKEQGFLSKESSKLVSCIKAMGGSEHAFVTGETVHSNSGLDGSGQRLDERVCYYDIQTSSSFSSLQPVRQYTEHEDLITCVCLFPPNSNLFLSGSRDFTVRVWDRRVDRCVGLFGTVGKTGRLQAHDAMITCLDAIDTNMILSAGMDTRILRWDSRTLGNQGGCGPVSTLQLDDSAVLKVALGGTATTAAVSTLRGLYLVDFALPRPIARLADPFKDGRRVGRYHDLKWAGNRNVLYAAGDDMRVDVYALR